MKKLLFISMLALIFTNNANAQEDTSLVQQLENHIELRLYTELAANLAKESDSLLALAHSFDEKIEAVKEKISELTQKVNASSDPNTRMGYINQIMEEKSTLTTHLVNKSIHASAANTCIGKANEYGRAAERIMNSM